MGSGWAWLRLQLRALADLGPFAIIVYLNPIVLLIQFRMSEMIGLSAFTNPTVSTSTLHACPPPSWLRARASIMEATHASINTRLCPCACLQMDEMRHYIGNGERFAWPFISHIQHNTAIERVISDALSRLRSGSLASLPPLGVRTGSDISEGTESDEEEEEGSEGPRSQDGEVKVLAQPSKVALDEENNALRKEVERLRTLLAQASVGEHDRQARRRTRVAPGGQVLEEEEPGLVSNKQAAH